MRCAFFFFFLSLSVSTHVLLDTPNYAQTEKKKLPKHTGIHIQTLSGVGREWGNRKGGDFSPKVFPSLHIYIAFFNINGGGGGGEREKPRNKRIIS